MEYDWIPDAFTLKFDRGRGNWREYYVVANSKDRETFTTYMLSSNQIGNDVYPLGSLLPNVP